MRLPEADKVLASPWDPQGTPAGGQFGQQWDEQQYGSMQPSYQYNNGADYTQVIYQDHAHVLEKEIDEHDAT